MTDTRFSPGTRATYIADHLIAIATTGTIDDRATSLCLSADWNSMVEAVEHDRFDAVVMHQHDQVRLAVRGASRVVVATTEGEIQFDGAAACATEIVEHAHLVTLMCDRADARSTPEYRADRGIVPASVVERRLGAPVAVPSDPFEVLFGHTVARSVEAAAVRPADLEAGQRPSLGVLVFSTGERVVLDNDVVIGRNPRSVEGLPNSRPRIVELAHPGVSRRHAVIHIDRWAASIEDLNSSNGTTVGRPGTAPEKLPPGAMAELEMGTVVELGGGVSFSVEEAA